MRQVPLYQGGASPRYPLCQLDACIGARTAVEERDRQRSVLSLCNRSERTATAITGQRNNDTRRRQVRSGSIAYGSSGGDAGAA